MRLPLIRLGLLLVVGSVFVSVINFYIGVGMQLGDLSTEDIATEPRDLFVHFRDNFLLVGGIAGGVFWAGIGLCIAGIAKNLFFGKRRARG